MQSDEARSASDALRDAEIPRRASAVDSCESEPPLDSSHDAPSERHCSERDCVEPDRKKVRVAGAPCGGEGEAGAELTDVQHRVLGHLVDQLDTDAVSVVITNPRAPSA